jgi:hypothetical protein
MIANVRALQLLDTSNLGSKSATPSDSADQQRSDLSYCGQFKDKSIEKVADKGQGARSQVCLVEVQKPRHGDGCDREAENHEQQICWSTLPEGTNGRQTALLLSSA